jgi:chemotaxis protein MotB
MCFFVLLLSFSEIDAQKFKQIAGELSQAFGVQREVPALEIPMGTSPVFDKFSPAPPEPTVVNEVKQTTSDQQPELETLRGTAEAEAEAAAQATLDDSTEQIRSVLDKAIKDGRVNVSQDDDERRIVIRVEEKGSFPSGSAQLTWEFEGLLLEMANVLSHIPGKLTIEGHTDNVPIHTDRFSSNWDLSAARAAAVANALLATKEVDPGRLAVKGLADTQPRVANDSDDNRAKNRRVEIIVDMSEPLHEHEVQLRELIESQGGDHDTVIDVRSGTSKDNQLSW